MRVFITGASGFIGSAVVPELIHAGHDVVGLARSEAAAATVAASGAEVRRGSLEDLDVLRDAVASADGVVHLGFIHDFANFTHSVQVDQAAIETMGEALAGSGKAFAIASGLLRLAPGPVITEEAPFDPHFPRAAAAITTLDFATRGVRSSVVRLPPTVHGAGDHGFVATLVGVARERGVSAYVGDGANRWSAVHRSDAARLFRLAVEHAPAGSVLNAVAEGGIPTRAIAAAIGRHLGVPVESVAAAAADEHFGWIGRFFAGDASASSARTREILGWEPIGATLLDDLGAGHYSSPGGARA